MPDTWMGNKSYHSSKNSNSSILLRLHPGQASTSQPAHPTICEFSRSELCLTHRCPLPTHIESAQKCLLNSWEMTPSSALTFLLNGNGNHSERTLRACSPPVQPCAWIPPIHLSDHGSNITSLASPSLTPSSPFVTYSHSIKSILHGTCPSTQLFIYVLTWLSVFPRGNRPRLFCLPPLSLGPTSTLGI